MISGKNTKTRAYDWGGNLLCELLPCLPFFKKNIKTETFTNSIKYVR